MKRASSICIAVAIILIILGSVFFYQGFDKKNNYYSDSTNSELSKNAYVGGDAYNYIINSEYFVGYIVMGSAAYICGSIFICLGIALFYKQDKDRSADTIINNNDQITELPPIE